MRPLQPIVDFVEAHKPAEFAFKNYTSFYAWHTAATDGTGYNTSLSNVFLQPWSFAAENVPALTHVLWDKLAALTSSKVLTPTCVGTLTGGAAGAVASDATAVPAHFRSSLISMSCNIAWTDDQPAAMQWIRDYAKDLHPMGNGTFCSEPDYWMPNFKERLFAEHYPKLLEIKDKWDPDNFFSCYHCVGSDD
eukprot:TRINITY_DN16783_c0_g1_i2.p2 TRINITY_DN16783_c0_g1~~TRINITY_DN16783_c0_g1_i2.p2  ORF type:complete len:192 (-),score=28.27 TRINITY_DN16783_c0_g1_i2:35-610(-)